MCFARWWALAFVCVFVSAFKKKALPGLEWVTTICCGSSRSGQTPRRAAGVKGGVVAEQGEGTLDTSEHRGQMAAR
jgi:hypothetical protein